MTIGMPPYEVIVVLIALLIGLYLFVWGTLGRFNRREYAITSFILLILLLFVFLGDLVLAEDSMYFFGMILYLIWVVASIRRFHDIDLSGWYVLLFLVPFVNILTWIYLFLKKGKGIEVTRWD